MAYTVGDVINNVICVPFLLLQILMLVFLIITRKTDSNYRTTFYNLFILVTFIDVFVIVINFFALQIHRFGPPTWISIYLEAYAFVCTWYFLSGWTLYVQCFIHLSIVVNRYWVIENILAPKHVSDKVMKLARHSLWIFPVFCFFLVFKRAFAQTIYVVRTDGSLAPKYVDPGIQEYQATVAILVLIFTGVTSFVFQAMTLLTYRQVLKQSHIVTQSTSREIRIVFQASIMLILHMGLAFFEIFIFIGVKTGEIMTLAGYFGYVDNAFCLCGSIVLLVVSEFVRKDFLKFYFPKLVKESTGSRVFQIRESRSQTISVA